jgi:hypothetical protein
VLQKKFISVYCYTPRYMGGQQRTYHDILSEAIRAALSDTPRDGPFKYCTENFTDVAIFDTLVSDWWAGHHSEPEPSESQD